MIWGWGLALSPDNDNCVFFDCYETSSVTVRDEMSPPRAALWWWAVTGQNTDSVAVVDVSNKSSPVVVGGVMRDFTNWWRGGFND